MTGFRKPGPLGINSQSIINRRDLYISNSYRPGPIGIHAVGALTHDEQFLLVDGNGKPLVGILYTAKLPSGELERGKTDSKGHTKRFYTSEEGKIEIHIGHWENT